MYCNILSKYLGTNDCLSICDGGFCFICVWSIKFLFRIAVVYMLTPIIKHVSCIAKRQNYHVCTGFHIPQKEQYNSATSCLFTHSICILVWFAHQSACYCVEADHKAVILLHLKWWNLTLQCYRMNRHIKTLKNQIPVNVCITVKLKTN